MRVYSAFVARNGSATAVGNCASGAEYHDQVAVSITLMTSLSYKTSKLLFVENPCNPFVLPPINNHLLPDCANAKECIPGRGPAITGWISTVKGTCVCACRNCVRKKGKRSRKYFMKGKLRNGLPIKIIRKKHFSLIAAWVKVRMPGWTKGFGKVRMQDLGYAKNVFLPLSLTSSPPWLLFLNPISLTSKCMPDMGIFVKMILS